MIVKQLIICLILLAAGPGGGMIGSEYFSVRYGPGEERLARAVHQAAMAGRFSVEKELKIAPGGLVTILLAPGGKESFQAAQPGETTVPDWAIGTAYPQGRTIVISHPDNLDFRYEDLEHVVIHEYTHVAVGAFLGEMRLPRWFDEGLASVVAGERSFNSSVTIGIAAITNKVIPFEQLDNSWPESGTQADLAYAESQNFLSWIKTEYGPGSLAAILKHYKETGNMDRALVPVTGKPLKFLEEQWRDRAVRKYIWIPVLTGGFTLWFIATIIFLLGYARKRRQAKLKMRMWELEDMMRGQWSATSTDDDDDLTPPPSLH